MDLSERLPVGERIKLIRQSRDVSQAELADRLCVAPGTIANYETGRRRIGAEDIERIADALGVQPTLFYDRDHWQRVQAALAEVQAILTDGTSKKEVTQVPEIANPDETDTCGKRLTLSGFVRETYHEPRVLTSVGV